MASDNYSFSMVNRRVNIIRYYRGRDIFGNSFRSEILVGDK